MTAIDRILELCDWHDLIDGVTEGFDCAVVVEYC